MSNNILTQSLTQVSTTLVDATLNVIDIPRFRTTPLEPPYAEGTDHVTRPDKLREHEGGTVIFREFPAVFTVANVFIRRISIRRLLPAAQKGLTGPAGALFPSGASTDQEFVRDVLNLAGNTLLLSDAATLEMLGIEHDQAPGRTYPGLTLMANEFVRLEIYNNTGGDIGPATIEAMYKMGRAQTDTGKP